MHPLTDRPCGIDAASTAPRPSATFGAFVSPPAPSDIDRALDAAGAPHTSEHGSLTAAQRVAWLAERVPKEARPQRKPPPFLLDRATLRETVEGVFLPNDDSVKSMAAEILRLQDAEKRVRMPDELVRAQMHVDAFLRRIGLGEIASHLEGLMIGDWLVQLGHAVRDHAKIERSQLLVAAEKDRDAYKRELDSVATALTGVGVEFSGGTLTSGVEDLLRQRDEARNSADEVRKALDAAEAPTHRPRPFALGIDPMASAIVQLTVAERVAELGSERDSANKELAAHENELAKALPDWSAVQPEGATIARYAAKVIRNQANALKLLQNHDPWKPAPPADYDRSVHVSPNAYTWAQFFVATFPGLADKLDLMQAWFANAMMAMHDHLRGPACGDAAAALAKLPQPKRFEVRKAMAEAERGNGALLDASGEQQLLERVRKAEKLVSDMSNAAKELLSCLDKPNANDPERLMVAKGHGERFSRCARTLTRVVEGAPPAGMLAGEFERDLLAKVKSIDDGKAELQAIDDALDDANAPRQAPPVTNGFGQIVHGGRRLTRAERVGVLGRREHSFAQDELRAAREALGLLSTLHGSFETSRLADDPVGSAREIHAHVTEQLEQRDRAHVTLDHAGMPPGKLALRVAWLHERLHESREAERTRANALTHPKASPGCLRIMFGANAKADCKVIDDQGRDLTRDLHVRSIDVCGAADKLSTAVLHCNKAEVDAEVPRERVEIVRAQRPD